MAWDPSDFDYRLANLKKCWAIAERLGRPVSPADKMWDALSLELEFSGKPLAELESVVWYARQWLATRNPHYIDAAVICCQDAGIYPPPTLLKLLTEVARVRVIARSGRPRD